MNHESIDKFRSLLRGVLILPEDPDYDTARAVYNGMHDLNPAMIVSASDVADVVAAVNFARQQGLLLAVRGGGHSVPGFGTCNDGLVIDLGGMNSIHVNPSDNTVRAEGGCTLGDLDHATHAYGLAVPGGTVSTTGLAGLTLGGGMGHLSRSCALSCDNLLSADVVTASGDIVSCSEDQHADLFWAIRGGGGNFGAVVSFKFKAFPVDTVFGGPTFFEIDADVMRKYELLMKDAPEQLNALFAIALAPPAPFVPEQWHLKPVMVILTCWSGAGEEDDNILKMVSASGKIVGQALWRMPYPEVNTFFDALLPAGLRHYWKACVSTGFTSGAIEAHLDHGPGVLTIEGGLFVFPINGACHRIADDDTAFANRHMSFSTVIAGTWQDPADDQVNTEWVRNYFEALKPWSGEGGYINFMSGDDQMLTDASFGTKYRRLREIKTRWDPDNLFSVNQNIAPLTEQE
jgi:FAD/FMN-containing dehydrogenase